VVCGVFLRKLPFWKTSELQTCETIGAVRTRCSIPGRVFILNCRICRLDRINDNIVRLPNLAVLNVSYNDLNYISANFFLTSLRVLNIGFNKLEKLEAAIG
jgi:hypothetical protein